MQYKLIAIDMDKTLIPNDGHITDRSIAAMHAAEETGVYVVLASGRMAANVKELYTPLDLHSPCICGGGSQVVDKDFNLIHTCYLDPQTAKRILDFAKERGIYAQIFKDDTFCFNKYCKYTDIYRGVSGLKPVEVPGLYEIQHIETPKVLIIEDAEKLIGIQKELEALFPELNIGRSRPTFLELNNPRGNKGVALKILSEKLGLKPSELIAIGDNQIDASMIEYAGLGVAIGNAIDEIKKIADYISADNDHEGVTEVIDKFILGK